MKIWKAIPIILLAACTGKDIHIDRITLDQPSLLLISGGSATVSVRFLSGKQEAVDWYSDDESVATVYNGNITGVEKGRTYVYALTESTGLMARCDVTVRNIEDMVSGVELMPSELTIEVESYEKLVANVLPQTAENKDVTWSSSDNSIATVGTGGIVYGLSEGEAVITVTTREGGFTASCSVTVNPKYYPLEGIGLIPELILLEVGDTYTLVPVFTPENASNKNVTWFSYDEGIASVDAEGVVTGVSPGGTYITVTAEDGGHSAIIYVRVEQGAE